MSRTLALGALLLAGCSLLVDLKGLDEGEDAPKSDGGVPSLPADAMPSAPSSSGSATSSGSSSSSSSSSSSGATVDAAGSRYRAAVLTDKPVAYWRLGEKAGGVTRDEVGTHDGTYLGALDFGVAGVLKDDPDTAIHFPATTGAVDMGDALDGVFAGQWAVEMWMKAEAFSNNNLYTERYMVSKLANPGTTTASGFHVWISAPYKDGQGGSHGPSIGMDYCDHTAPAGKRCIGLGTTFTTDLVHLAVVRDSAQVTIFLNGLDVAHGATDLHAPDNSVRLQIGAEQGKQPFGGVLDEVAIYDHPLTSAQLKAHIDAAE